MKCWQDICRLHGEDLRPLCFRFSFYTKGTTISPTWNTPKDNSPQAVQGSFVSGDFHPIDSTNLWKKAASCNTMVTDPEVASYCVRFHGFSWWIYVERQESCANFVPPDMFKMLSFQTLKYDKVILKFIRLGWNMMNLTLLGRVTWHRICMTC